ncbi:MAG: DMT family transporter [Planctomycetota bacterium]
MQIFLLLVGVLALSTAVIFIKLCDTDPTLLTASRLVVAVIALLPIVWADWRKHRDRLNWSHLRDAAVPGVLLALHFITWMIGARMTDVANSSLIVNTSPVVAPLLLWLVVGERVTRWELLATATAGVGLAILFVSDYRLSAESFRGDLICFGSMLLMALYLVLAKRFRHHPTVWLYVAPVYASAAVVSAAASPVLVRDWSFSLREDLPYVLALGLIPTVIGHSLITNAMQRLRGQLVMIVNLLQFVFAGVMGLLILGEWPLASFYSAAVFVVAAGVMVALRRQPARVKKEDE